MLVDKLQSDDSKVLLEMMYKIRGKMSALDKKLDVILLKDKDGDKTIKQIDDEAREITQDLLIHSGIVQSEQNNK